MQDWSGNKKAVFVTNGDSSHSQQARADWDYYATDPRAVAELLKRETFSDDGTCFNYRYGTKAEAKKAAAQIGVKL